MKLLMLSNPSNVNMETYAKQFLQRRKDIYLQSLMYSESNRINDYLRFKDNSDIYKSQIYLDKVRIVEHRTTLTHLRADCICWAQDTGKYENIPQENRICPLCKQGVKDLSHFLFTYKGLAKR